jgi:hypothetical protein
VESAYRRVVQGNGELGRSETIRVIAWVDTSTRRKRREFWFACIKHGLTVHAVQTVGQPEKAGATDDWGNEVGANTAYDVSGNNPNSIMAAVAVDAVYEWHYAFGIRVPFVATGSGPEKKIRPKFTAREVDAMSSTDLLGLNSFGTKLPFCERPGAKS